MNDAATGLEGYWRDLVTTAMLGTDRRDPPSPPEGAVAELVADTVRSDPASRMVATVAAVATARRAGFAAGPAAPGLQPPGLDAAAAARPWCPVGAVDVWRRIVAEWPVLEDEWVLRIVDSGYALAPDVLVELLVRHRRDPVRRARVMLAGGPVASWVVEHVPDLAATSQQPVDASLVRSLPELPIPPDLDELRTRDAHSVAAELAAGCSDGRFGAPERAVLINLLARCRPDVCEHVADVLAGVEAGLALALSDLARLRALTFSQIPQR